MHCTFTKDGCCYFKDPEDIKPVCSADIEKANSLTQSFHTEPLTKENTAKNSPASTLIIPPLNTVKRIEEASITIGNPEIHKARVLGEWKEKLKRVIKEKVCKVNQSTYINAPPVVEHRKCKGLSAKRSSEPLAKLHRFKEQPSTRYNVGAKTRRSAKMAGVKCVPIVVRGKSKRLVVTLRERPLNNPAH